MLTSGFLWSPRRARVGGGGRGREGEGRDQAPKSGLRLGVRRVPAVRGSGTSADRPSREGREGGKGDREGGAGRGRV